MFAKQELPPPVCLTARSLKVTPVVNGYMIEALPLFGEATKTYPDGIYVFSNAGALAAWMEQWGVDRAKERKGSKK